jgi:hypothetical protein
MNTRILLLVVSVAALSSCSSVYKSGQTPDDVYYSPAPVRVQADEYVDVKQPKQGTNYQSYEQYADNQRDDRFLRMSVGNPYYMNAYNSYGGFDWRYNSFYDGFNYGFSSPWNNYFAWNNFYNPYAPGLYLGYGGGYYGGGYYGGGYGSSYYGGGGGVKYTYNTAPISRPRVFNVNSYTNSNRPAARTYTNGNYYNNSNGNTNRSSNNSNSYYNNTNNGRSTYTPSNSNTNSNSNNTYTPSRSYTPASSGSSSSSSSSGGGGGGGGVSRPSRGN